MKLWSGRFTKETDKAVEAFTSSIEFDKRLYKHDIAGSIAHAKMLAKTGIILPEEEEQIITGLEEIQKEIEDRIFEFKPELEDIHMHIEQALTKKIGESGEKIHTARSRNDQVALDTRLYLREEINNIIELIKNLQQIIIQQAEDNIDVIMPGYTHLQHAEPVLFSHHLMAYFWMIQRDVERLQDCYKRVNIMPLGAAALAGTSLPIDRRYVAELLEFQEITQNSIDTVSDRDYIVEFLSGASLIMMHLSRISEELILWSTIEFGFIELDDAFCTGSSIMPQKKNPDICELTRGKTGRVYGHLFSLLTMMKGLPLSYNRDMQEDKEPLFDTIETLKMALSCYKGMLDTLIVKKKQMYAGLEKDFSIAVEMANYLVKKGVPFRQAHHIVGNIVGTDKQPLSFSLEELKQFSSAFSEDIFDILKPDEVVEKKISYGGTSSVSVQEQIKKAKVVIDSF